MVFLLRTRSVLGQHTPVSKADPIPRPTELAGNYYVTLMRSVRRKYRYCLVRHNDPPRSGRILTGLRTLQYLPKV